MKWNNLVKIIRSIVYEYEGEILQVFQYEHIQKFTF